MYIQRFPYLRCHKNEGSRQSDQANAFIKHSATISPWTPRPRRTVQRLGTYLVQKRPHVCVHATCIFMREDKIKETLVC